MREEAGREQIAEFGFQLGNSGSAYDYGICSYYYRVRKTIPAFRKSVLRCSGIESHFQPRWLPTSPDGASWRVFAFDWFGRALAGTPLHAEFLVVSFFIQVPTRGWMDAHLPDDRVLASA